MMGKMEVVNNEIPSLCLDPKPPQIYAVEAPPLRVVEPTRQRTSQGHNPRIKKTPQAFGVEVQPGDIPHRVKPSKSSVVKEMTEQSALMTRVKNDEHFISALGEKMQAYDHCSEVKKIVHEQDYLDHFYKPLTYRIREEITGPKHRVLSARRSRAIKKMDEDPIPIRANRKLPKIPCASVTRQGLKDPTYKYIQHRAKEMELEAFLAKSVAQDDRRRNPRVRQKSLDYNKYDLERQTRFFYGKTEEADRVGRRSFVQHNASNVYRATDMFGGPLP